MTSAIDLECVVLCGGLGTRLRGVIDGQPKSMVSILGRPFLERLLRALKSQGVRNFVLATGYRSDQIEEYVGDGSYLGVSMRISRQASPLGTAGALRLALQEARGPYVLVVNGDSYARPRIAQAATHPPAGRRRCHAAARAGRRRRSVRDRGGRRRRPVLSYREKQGSGPGWISAGIWVFKRSEIEALPPNQQLSIEEDLLHALVGHHKCTPPFPWRECHEHGWRGH